MPHEPALVVTWAPTSPRRRRQRGFDQAELLARAVGRRAGLPVRRLLSADRAPPRQGARRGSDGSTPGSSPRGVAPAAVLLIDDVATTGATLSAAARALRRAGAEVVHGLVVARAPAGRPEQAWPATCNVCRHHATQEACPWRSP